MCRFFAYKGEEKILNELIIKPSHSILKQSYNALERKEPLNGDGFGIGWYDDRIGPDPAVFKEITPAWSNENLREVSNMLLAKLCFAHVRAASAGLAVNTLNCHPFKYGNLLWMHNGKIGSFLEKRREFTNRIADPYYGAVKGSTDSEYAFGIFLTKLDPEKNPKWTADDLYHALKETIREILLVTEDSQTYSSLNLAVSDGVNMAFTRYTSKPDGPPPTLYYVHGGSMELENDKLSINDTESTRCFMVASEAVNYEKHLWREIPPNHCLTIDRENNFSLKKLD